MKYKLKIQVDPTGSTMLEQDVEVSDLYNLLATYGTKGYYDDKAGIYWPPHMIQKIKVCNV